MWLIFCQSETYLLGFTCLKIMDMEYNNIELELDFLIYLRDMAKKEIRKEVLNLQMNLTHIFHYGL